MLHAWMDGWMGPCKYACKSDHAASHAACAWWGSLPSCIRLPPPLRRSVTPPPGPHLLDIGLLQTPYGLVHLEVIVGRERLDGLVERLVEEDVIGDLSGHSSIILMATDYFSSAV